MWHLSQLLWLPETPMQKLFRTFLLPTSRMPFPSTYSVLSQFQCEDDITSAARPLWQETHAAVTSWGFLKVVLSWANFEWSTDAFGLWEKRSFSLARGVSTETFFLRAV